MVSCRKSPSACKARKAPAIHFALSVQCGGGLRVCLDIYDAAEPCDRNGIQQVRIGVGRVPDKTLVVVADHADGTIAQEHIVREQPTGYTNGTSNTGHLHQRSEIRDLGSISENAFSIVPNAPHRSVILNKAAVP
jgi:hypothetical protein